MSLKLLHLQAGERIEAVVRKHGSTLWSPLLASAFLIVTPFFFLLPLLQLGWIGKVVLAACEVTGCLMMIRAFFIWNFDVLVITSDRVVRIDQAGMWKRRIQEIPLRLIREIGCDRSGFMDAMRKIGTLWIKTAADAKPVTAPRIAHPEAWQQRINQLRGTPI